FHPGCLATALARCFITNGRLPLSRQVGRQRIPLETATLRVRFRYGSRVRFPRLQPTDFAVSCSGRYMSNEQFTWWVPFIPLDQPGLSWRTDREGAFSANGKRSNFLAFHIGHRGLISTLIPTASPAPPGPSSHPPL